jgi:hypothetical protein
VPQYERSNERSAINQMGYPSSAPVIVQQGNSGVGNMIAGFLLGRAMSGEHSRQHEYRRRPDFDKPAISTGGVLYALMRVLAWLLIVAIAATGVYFIWKYLRRGRAPSTANYAFER